MKSLTYKYLRAFGVVTEAGFSPVGMLMFLVQLVAVVLTFSICFSPTQPGAITHYPGITVSLALACTIAVHLVMKLLAWSWLRACLLFQPAEETTVRPWHAVLLLPFAVAMFGFPGLLIKALSLVAEPIVVAPDWQVLGAGFWILGADSVVGELTGVKLLTGSTVTGE